jgi:hypothetical protein
VTEPLIERSEVVALLFGVSDLSLNVAKIVDLLRGDDDEEEEADGG